MRRGCRCACPMPHEMGTVWRTNHNKTKLAIEPTPARTRRDSWFIPKCRRKMAGCGAYLLSCLVSCVSYRARPRFSSFLCICRRSASRSKWLFRLISRLHPQRLANVSVSLVSLQREFNQDFPTIFTTYQCYLKDSLERLAMDLERADRGG